MRCISVLQRLALVLAVASAALLAWPATAGPSAANPVLRHVPLPPPAPPRDFDDLQQLFAQRLVAAHPEATYLGAAPDRLYAIPVLEVELERDGSVHRIVVLRRPSTGDEATRLAIAAVRNAAPYGDLSQVPKPWKVVEFFLFDDDLKFKPRTLDR